MTLIETIGPVAGEMEVDLVTGEISADGKCTRLHVPSAGKIVKFHFGQAAIGRYTAVTVLKKGEMKMVISENQVTETLEDQNLKKDDHTRRIVATKEMRASMTMDSWWSN